MSQIKFSKEEKEHLISKLQNYFEDELEHNLGQFEGDFLLDFISKEIGASYYNQGLKDAQTVLAMKLEDLNEAIEEIEKPSSFSR